ncbi:hypothetical protein [Actinocrispum wychmicini]|uniref:Uncharacterized protein n=1 Tax=Actinocrispum wychmicini TaxID=1213861 RepID=A0A4R2JDK1_9PSEU|nr:hypothetical protein [Actinocrispum wychmicini]TCO54269.1 hypothetical protein EV192_109249 [Actinocrispum wychmicini]
MFILEPVVDTSTTTGFALWPVATPPADRVLHVSANLSTQEVGTAMAALAAHHLDDAHAVTDVLDELVQAECLIVSGGLLARDTRTGVTIPPSCCCGLEGWREWAGALDGGKPWLGHSPAPWIEHLDGALRIWPDGGMGEDLPRVDRTITASLDSVTGQLRRAHQDLRGFLHAVSRWVQDRAPHAATRVIAKLDKSFQITDNLILPTC